MFGCTAQSQLLEILQTSEGPESYGNWLPQMELKLSKAFKPMSEQASAYSLDVAIPYTQA